MFRTSWLFALPLILHGQASVDSRVCAECHPGIAETYARTGMARSFRRLAPQSIPRSEPFLHKASDTWYQMIERGGASYQRRWRIGPDGAEIHAQERKVDYVMGSGNHARTYLHRTPRGTLIELDLGWYAENGGSWAMSPGHDRDYTLAPRTIAYECMFCHNGYPRIPGGHEEPGSEAVYEGALPEGIDCQRCHGPGGNHVRAAQGGANVEQVRQAIVNPKRLSPQRQMEVCMQCHLETTSLQLPHSILRYGRNPFSYKPGDALGSFLLFFDHAPGSKYQDDFEIAHSAYRLRRSQCFLKSAGKLTCTTCHNPHDIPRGAEAVAHYDASCRTCHATVAAANHSGVTNCAGCHMPQRRTQDVVHAVMTDHLIQRRPPAGDLVAPLREREEFDAGQYRGEVVSYYPSPLPQTPENALYLAVAQVTQKSNLAKGLPRLAAEVEKQKPARREFYVELGQAWLAANKPANAVAAFDEAMKRKPDSPAVLLSLGDALTQAGQTARAVSVLTRAVKVAPSDPLLWYQLGIAQSRADQPAQAIAALERAVTADPDLAEAHNLLGELRAGGGDMARAEQSFRQALQINPDYADALGNLGHLCAARGEFAQAAFHFARALKIKPKDAEILTNYAVTLAALNRMDEALLQAQAAVAADPKSADARNFHGTLLERAGKRDQALSEFLTAIRLRPDFGLAHVNAAMILAAQGQRAAAEQHLRIALQNPDPNVRRRAQDAMRRIGIP